MTRSRVAVLTLLSLVAFASNSLLCRAALQRPASIDPASFTTMRIASGAFTLILLSMVRNRQQQRLVGNWSGAMALFIYAAAFSFAYTALTTGTGALLLFGAVQITMLSAGLWKGERLSIAQWSGLAGALAGLVVLCAPGVRAPQPLAALLMVLAGMAWGLYSLLGRRSGDPQATTAGNFVRAVPLALLVTVVSLESAMVTTAGILLAGASGALASGIGYTLWYSVLPHLAATRAAILQLSVPLLAALAGIVILGESFTVRLAVAAMLIIGGIMLSIVRRR